MSTPVTHPHDHATGMSPSSAKGLLAGIAVFVACAIACSTVGASIDEHTMARYLVIPGRLRRARSIRGRRP